MSYPWIFPLFFPYNLSSPLPEIVILKWNSNKAVFLYPVEKSQSPLLCSCLSAATFALCCQLPTLPIAEFIQLFSCYFDIIALFCHSAWISVFIMCTYFLVFSSSCHQVPETFFVFICTQSLKSHKVIKASSTAITISSFRVRIFTYMHYLHVLYQEYWRPSHRENAKFE